MEQPNKISAELVAQKQEALARTSQEKIQSLRNAAKELNTPTLQSPTVPQNAPVIDTELEENAKGIVDGVQHVMATSGANPKDILNDMNSMSLTEYQAKYGYDSDIASDYLHNKVTNKVAPAHAKAVRDAVIEDQGILSQVGDVGLSLAAGGVAAVGNTAGFGASVLANPDLALPTTVDTVTGLAADFTGNDELRTHMVKEAGEIKPKYNTEVFKELAGLRPATSLGDYAQAGLEYVAGNIYKGTDAVAKWIRSGQSDALNARNEVRKEKNDVYTKELKASLGEDASTFETMASNTKIGFEAFTNLLTDPASALNVTAESVPSLLIAGGMASSASKTALKKAQEQIAKDMMKAGPVTQESIIKAVIAQGDNIAKSQKAAATQAGLVQSGVQEGAGAASEVYNNIMGAKLDVLAKTSNRFNELVTEGMPAEEAQQQLAIEASLGAGTTVMAIATGITAITGAAGVINKVGGVGDSASKGAKASAADAFREGVEETFQSFTSAYVSGTKERENINPDLDVGARSAVQAGEGALAGAATGGSIPAARSVLDNAIAGVETFDEKVRSTATRNAQAKAVREGGVTKDSANTNSLGYSLYANVKGMAANNIKEDVTLEQVGNNIDLMAEAVTKETSTIDELTKIYGEMSNQEKLSKKGKAVHKDILTRGEEIDKASKLIMEEASKYHARKAAGKSVDTAVDNIVTGKVEDNDNDIILGSMSSFQLTEAQATELSGSENVTPVQKQVLEAYKTTKAIVDTITDNADKDMQGVNTEVISGGKGFIGITQYLASIASSIRLGNQSQADQALGMLEAFSQQRIDKVKDLQEGYDLFMKGASLTDGEVARIKEIESKYSTEGAKPFKIGVGTPKLLPVIQQEAELTIAAVAQATAMTAGMEISPEVPNDTVVEEAPVTEAPAAPKAKVKKTSQEMTAETLANIPNMTQQQLLDGKARREKLLAKEGKVAMKPETIQGLKTELAAINEALKLNTKVTPKGNYISQTTEVTSEIIDAAYNTPKPVPTGISEDIKSSLRTALRDEYDNLAFDARPVKEDYSPETYAQFEEDAAVYDESAELYNMLDDMINSELSIAETFKKAADKFYDGSVTKLMSILNNDFVADAYNFNKLFDELNNSQLDFGQGELNLSVAQTKPADDVIPETTSVDKEVTSFNYTPKGRGIDTSPVKIGVFESAPDGRLANTKLSTGNVSIRRNITVAEFVAYLKGDGINPDGTPSLTSAQKSKVQKLMDQAGYSIEYIISVLNTNAKVRQFIIEHELGHLDQISDAGGVANFKKLYSQDPIQMEFDANLKAIGRLGIPPEDTSAQQDAQPLTDLDAYMDMNPDTGDEQYEYIDYEGYAPIMNDDPAVDTGHTQEQLDTIEPVSSTGSLATSGYSLVQNINVLDAGTGLSDINAAATNTIDLVPKDSVIDEATALENKQISSDTFKETNLFKKYFKIMTKQGETTNPLHVVKDFMGTLKGNIANVAAEFGELRSITGRQRRVLEDVAEYHESFKTSLLEIFVGKTGEDAKFKYRDMMQFLTDQSGMLEDNVIAAFSLAAYNFESTKASDTINNDDATIRAMFGIDKEVVIPSEVYNMAKHGTIANQLNATLGNQVMAALGISPRNGFVPTNHTANFAESLGQLVVATLVHQGSLVYAPPINTKTLTSLLEGADATSKLGGKEQIHLVHAAMEGDKVIPELRQMAEVVKGTQGILEKVFKVASFKKGPKFVAPEGVNKKVRGTKQTVSPLMQDIIKKHQDRPHKFKHDIHGRLMDMPEPLRLQMLGYIEDTSGVHDGNKASVDSANAGILRGLEYVTEFYNEIMFNSFDGDPEFFFEHYVMKNGRLGMDSNTFNPQGNKVHRHLVSMEGWASTFKPAGSDTKKEALFLLAFAQGMGVGIDKTTNDMSIAKVKELLDSDIVKNAVQALVDSKGKDITQEQAEAITAGVAAGKEKMWSFEALVAMADYEIAKRDGTDFTHSLILEADGITNGPAIASLQFGIGKSIGDSLERLHKVGIYLSGTNQEYGEFRSKVGNYDNYETVTLDLDRELQTTYSPIIDLGNIVFGPLVVSLGEDGALKINRSISKQPLMTTIYGVGEEKLSNNIGNAAITAIYEILESKDEAKIKQMVKVLRDIGVSSETLNGFMNPKTALSTTLKYNEAADIHAEFAEVYGGKMNEAIDASYGEFKETALTINTMYTTMYGNFSRVFNFLVAERTKQLQDAGVLAVSINKTTGATAALESLPKAEIDAIMEELISMQPIIGTLFSDESNNLRNGVYVGKTFNAAVEDAAHKTEQKYKIAIPSGSGGTKKSTATYSSELQLAAPGVSPVVLAIQNYDAVTMMLHLQEYGSLNIYDAIITGVDQIVEHTQDMNRAHMEAHTQKRNIIDQVLAADARSRKFYAEYSSILGPYTEISKFKLKDMKVKPNDLKGISSKSKDIISKITGMAQYYFEGATFRPSGVVLTEVRDVVKAVVKAGTEKGAIQVVASPEEKSTAIDLSSIAGYSKEEIASTISTLRKYLTGRGPIASQVRDIVGDLWAKSLNTGVDIREAINTSLSSAPVEVVDGFLKSLDQLVEYAPKGKLNFALESDAAVLELFKDTDTINTKTAVDSIVKELATSGTTGKGIAYIIKKIEPLIKDTSIVLIKNKEHLSTLPTDAQTFFGTANDGRGGAYFKATDTVYLISPDLHGNNNTGARYETLAHELLHAALLGKLSPSSKSKLSNEVLLAQKDLVNILNEIKKTPELNDGSNAVADVDELVSWAFTNVKVQEVMKATTLKSKSFLGQNAFTTFVKKISSIIFGTPVANPNLDNAMVRLITAVTTIVNANTPNIDPDSSLGSSNRGVNTFTNDLETKINSATASAVFDMLEAVGNKAESATHKVTLKTIISNLHPVLKELTLRLQDGVDTTHGLIKGDDVYMWTQLMGTRNNSQATGQFEMSAQEVYVHELVHSVAKEGISGNSRAKKALHELWDRARKTITVADLAGPNVVQGSPEWDDAQAQWDYMFRPKTVNANGTSNHLQEFAALGMTNERIGNLLQGVPHRVPKARTSQGFDLANLLESLTDLIHHIANIVSNRLTNTSGMNGQQELNALVLQLAGVTAQNKNLLMSVLDKGGQGIGVLGDITVTAVKKVASPLAKLANNVIIKPSGSALLRVGGRVLSMAATSDKLPALVFLNAIDNLTNYNAGKQTILGEMYTDAKGLTERNSVFTTLARLKNASVDTARESIKANIAKVLNKIFDGLGLSKEEYAAISGGFLRADVSALGLTHKEMVSLYSGSKDLDSRIAEEVSKLSGDPEYDYYISRAKALGYFMVTETATISNLNMSAYQIANLFGETRVNPNAAAVESTIDRLASLYAIKYTPAITKHHLKNALAKANGQAADANAFEFLSNFHNEMKTKDKESLFNDEERANIIKGYTRDIVDPRTQVVTMSDADADAAELLKKGWVRGEAVPRDPADPIQTPVSIYIYKFGAEAGVMSGIISTTSKNAKGQNTTDIVMNPNIAKGNTDFQTFARAERIGKSIAKAVTRNIATANQKLDSKFDPLSVTGNKMVPTYDLNGAVQGYRYVMKSKTKDKLLSRDNNFVNILATQSGRTVEKVAAADMNTKAIQALADAYRADAADNKLGGYVTFGPDSTDPEILELYRLLPYEAKKQMRAAFANRNAMVHKELLHLVFGQRKLSLADKAQYDNLQGSMMKQALAMTVGLLGAPFGLKPNQTISAIGQAWQDYVQAVKQFNIIKSGIVTVQNTISNTNQLYVRNVKPSDILKYNVEAYTEANNYIYDVSRLKELEVMISTGYQSSDRANQEAKLALLRTKIAENPVAGLITEGMLQSIVEDVDMVQDTYSASNWISDKVMNSDFVSKVPNWVRKGGQELFMTQGSSLFKGMAKAAQLSDFAARYALYKHLTENSGVARNDAINQAMEVFVNYDYSTNKYVQWLNDNGLVWYTKYYLRIQKTILGDLRHAPGKVLGVLALDTATGGNISHIYSTIATPENILNRMGLPDGPVDTIMNAATLDMLL